MKSLVTGLTAVLLVGFVGIAAADNVPQTLPFSQNWSSTGLITVNDDWSGVPGILGYLGDNPLTTTAPVRPNALLGDSTGAIDVIANQTNPNTLTAGGVGEFDTLIDPTVALQGSGSGDFPHLRLHINTTGYQNITVACNLRDIDGAADNSVQAIAVQYRVGNTGTWTNVAFVADATTGPSQATLVTPVSVVLPAAANNVPEINIRIMTGNASGNDEWVGIDDISVTGTLLPVPVENTTWGAIKAQQ